MKSLRTPALIPGFRVGVLHGEDVPPAEPAVINDVSQDLRRWIGFAQHQHETQLTALEDLRHRRADLGADYYAPEHAKLRAEYKRTNNLAHHFAASAALTRQIHDALSTPLTRDDVFLFLYRGNELQGVMALNRDEKFIERMVGNPANMVPAGGYTPVRGVAKQLISSAISYYAQSTTLDPRRRAEPLELTAADNKVKKIYEHYGFRVVPFAAPGTRQPIARAPGTKRHGQLTGWHHNNLMELSQDGAERLQRELVDWPRKQIDSLVTRTGELAQDSTTRTPHDQQLSELGKLGRHGELRTYWDRELAKLERQDPSIGGS